MALTDLYQDVSNGYGGEGERDRKRVRKRERERQREEETERVGKEVGSDRGERGELKKSKREKKTG